MADAIKSPALRALVYGHLWLALGAFAQVWWVGERFLVKADLRLAMLAGFATIAAYGSMRLVRMTDPAVQGSPMVQWFRANTPLMVGAALVCAALATWLAWPSRSTVLHALWKPGLLAALYLLPVPLKRGRSIGLRNVPFLKAFVIATVWASVTTVLPGLTSSIDGEQAQDGLWWMFAVQFCFFLALAITFDVRDMPYDPPGLRTVPQVLGVRGAKFLAVLLLLPMCFLLILMSWVDLGLSRGEGSGMDLAYALPLLGVIVLGIAIVLAESDRPWWYFPVLLDGALLFIPLLSWVGSAVQ